MGLSEKQLKARMSGLGGSDMVAICGFSKYRAPIDVWLQKRHGQGLEVPVSPSSFDGNERTEWGHILEPVIADRYARETGFELVDYKTTFRRSDRSWQIGTPDRGVYEHDIGRLDEEKMDAPLCANYVTMLNAESGNFFSIPKPDRIWEGKTHGFYGGQAYDLDNMELPEDKKIQCHWYMSLLGVKRASLSALIDSHIYRVFEIEHDQAIEDYLLEEAEKFWGLVMSGKTPQADGSDSFKKYLLQRFNNHSEDYKDVSSIENADKMLSLYKSLRASIKESKEKMDIVGSQIKDAIGSELGIIGNNRVLATWKRQKRGKVSTKLLIERLRQEYNIPDAKLAMLEDECRGEPSRTLLVK